MVATSLDVGGYPYCASISKLSMRSGMPLALADNFALSAGAGAAQVAQKAAGQEMLVGLTHAETALCLEQEPQDWGVPCWPREES